MVNIMIWLIVIYLVVDAVSPASVVPRHGIRQIRRADTCTKYKYYESCEEEEVAPVCTDQGDFTNECLFCLYVKFSGKPESTFIKSVSCSLDATWRNADTIDKDEKDTEDVRSEDVETTDGQE